MRSFCLLAVTILIAFASFGQQQLNLKLKKELDSIYTEDQQYRNLLFSDQLKDKTDSIAAFYKVNKKELINFLMLASENTDSTNMVRVREIIRQYGYPGKSLVGVPANEAAFFVIQHSKNIDEYLPLIKKAAEQKELRFQLYAMMLDRSLMHSGKEQLYGTQGKGIQVTDKQTGKKIFTMIIWPIKNEKTVNALRKKAGFSETVEENAKRLGIDYIVYTLKQVKELEQ